MSGFHVSNKDSGYVRYGTIANEMNSEWEWMSDMMVVGALVMALMEDGEWRFTY